MDTAAYTEEFQREVDRELKAIQGFLDAPIEIQFHIDRNRFSDGKIEELIIWLNNVAKEARFWHERLKDTGIDMHMKAWLNEVERDTSMWSGRYQHIESPPRRDRLLLQRLLENQPNIPPERYEASRSSITRASRNTDKDLPFHLREILNDTGTGKQDSYKDSLETADRLLRNKEVLVRLCAALKASSNDLFEISKVTTPVLIALVAAQTIVLPMVPVVFAAVAVLIYRMGVASICKEASKSDSEKKSDD